MHAPCLGDGVEMSRYLPSGTAGRVVSRLRTTAEHNDYLYDPTAWLEDKLGWVWSKQADIADSVCDHRHTAVHSCHASGEVARSGTRLLVVRRASAWRSVRGNDRANPAAGRSDPVARDRRNTRSLGLDGYITAGNQPQWKLSNGELIAFGRKPADYIDVEQAKAPYQGIHAR